MKKNSGFSLIETLVVIAVLGVLGVILSELLSGTLSGGRKTQILTSIRQNGQTALNIIDQSIRASDEVICSEAKTLTVLKNGAYTRFKFYFEQEQKRGENGYIAYDNPRPAEDPSLLCSADNVLQNPVILTDNQSSGVSLKKGSFGLIEKSGFKELVSVKFTLGPPLSQTSQEPIVDFQTTVALR